MPGIKLNGKVTLVSQAATKSGDAVNYPVRIEVDPAGKPLLPAMSATGSIITDQATGVLRLSNRFIRLDRTGKAFARVRQPDGTFKDVQITLGVRNDTYTEVKQGLNAGDVVGLPATNTGGPGGGNFPAGAILGGRGG
jgi:multidrug efflux pump subunit AcrA (membrane-fusion protein)